MRRDSLPPRPHHMFFNTWHYKNTFRYNFSVVVNLDRDNYRIIYVGNNSLDDYKIIPAETRKTTYSGANAAASAAAAQQCERSCAARNRLSPVDYNRLDYFEKVRGIEGLV